jgi:hypothetical protein
MQYGVMFRLDAMIDHGSVIFSDKLDSLEQSPIRCQGSRRQRGRPTTIRRLHRLPAPRQIARAFLVGENR